MGANLVPIRRDREIRILLPPAASRARTYFLSLARRYRVSPLAENKPPLHTRQRALRRLKEEARIKGGNDAIVRACMVGFGIAIAAIAPVPWGWKIALFFVIMFVVGIIIPAIWWARRNPN
jgi:type IV secretory pathway TrbD component